MREFLQKWKKAFAFAVVASMFISLLQLTFSFYMFAIYRNIVSSFSVSSLGYITILAIGALAFYGLFDYLRSRLLQRAGNALQTEHREQVFVEMVRDNARLDRRAYQQGLSDLDTLRNYFTTPALAALFDAPWVPVYLVLIFFLHPLMGAVASGGALIVLALSVVQELVTRQRLSQANTANMANKRFVDAVLRNAEAVNSMGMVGSLTATWEQSNHRVMGLQVTASRYAGLIQSVVKPMQNIMQVLIYAAGAYLAIVVFFDPGLFVVASIIMGRAVGPLMQVVNTWRQTAQARDAYQRLNRFHTVKRLEARESLELPAPQGRIDAAPALTRLGGQLVLRDVRFQLEPGEFMGVIGPSGAGKSTLCRLLVGIWPALLGGLRLDGVDISDWDQRQLSRHVGYLPQEIELFPGTVAQNIARMGEPDPELLDRAVEAAGLEDLVEQLPDGLETSLEGSEGVGLSGGQKQRVALARALYGNPAVLVFDEPGSNLDEAGEARLLATLGGIKARAGATCIMVTHKPELLQSADKLLVMHNGATQLFGPREVVWNKLVQGKAAA